MPPGGGKPVRLGVKGQVIDTSKGMRELAQEYEGEAIALMVNVMRGGKRYTPSQIRCAENILERARGKATQEIVVESRWNLDSDRAITALGALLDPGGRLGLAAGSREQEDAEEALRDGRPAGGGGQELPVRVVVGGVDQGHGKEPGGVGAVDAGVQG